MRSFRRVAAWLLPCNKCYGIPGNGISTLYSSFKKQNNATMTVEQIYTGCLAQGAYYIASKGEAAIIDPLRETAPYLERLQKDGATLKYIFETHFHADFVSGHLDLSEQTGAAIVYGPTAHPEFEALIATDGQIFEVGDVRIKVLHTPGHTLESTSYLLIDENGKETALFSGDTLFLGDVGRPDLAQKAANLTQEELAGLLYDSLYQKILPLPNDLVVYPAHGAGSACGKNMMKETVDTLGNQKKVNYALNQPDKASFVAAVTEGLLPPPAYFGMNVVLNKKGSNRFDAVLQRGLNALSANAFEATAESTGALLRHTQRPGICQRFYSAIDKYWPRRRFCALGGCADCGCSPTYPAHHRPRKGRRSGYPP